MPTAEPREDEIPAWVLTVLVAAGQAIAVALIIAIGSAGTLDVDYGAYLFAAGFGAVLLLRRIVPVTVLIVSVLGVFSYYAFDFPPIGMAVPVVGAFYSVTERGRVVVATVAGLVLLGVSLYFRVGDRQPSTVLAYDLITNVALVGCAIALALTVRSRRDLRDQQRRVVLLEREHQQERAARQLEAERLRLARDVHDSVGHALSLVSVQARVAQQSLGSDQAAVARALDNVVSATGSSLADLRRTLTALHSDQAVSLHAPVTLRGIEHTAEAARQAGLDVDVSITTGPADVPEPVAGTAFRIVQEAVTNVLRHAHATRASITVTAEAGTLRLRVADNGTGLGEAGEDGRGMTGMRERAALVGGTVTVESQPTGVTVTAELPTEESP
ncbi:hypothetical protein BAY61_24840 [Prauserella marina]|uniref:histidine kinase n=1 Tax=Prauserella marina TaxID=530584 RepID=A0A222W0S2_9PSEU|nr:sensor histidine kinase [Prauserella marina]ASR39632.1 hypothetical protein BAY61_24840 [Prauserella marina]PWV75625.1 signal transduction histidine kinase [Prauserella marina]SDD30270.1 Signal transduction histidine kinase [Prauserella marina]